MGNREWELCNRLTRSAARMRGEHVDTHAYYHDPIEASAAFQAFDRGVDHVDAALTVLTAFDAIGDWWEHRITLEKTRNLGRCRMPTGPERCGGLSTRVSSTPVVRGDVHS